MTFGGFDEAWDFWVTYGVRMGFDVRKCYTNMSGLDGLVTSSRFVCSNEGSRAENKRFCIVKRNRAQTRTGCRVHMGITLDRENGTYTIHDLFVEHNHILQTAQTSHLMPSQRNISKHQAIDIEVVDDSGITPKAAHEFLVDMLVDHLTLDTPIVIIKIICELNAEERCCIVRLEVY